MNFKNETIRTIKALAEQNPEYSFGDLMYSCFQNPAVKNKQSLNFFRSISDEDSYTLAEQALNKEKDE